MDRIAADDPEFGDFGESFRLTNAAGETRLVDLIFDEDYELLSPGDLGFAGTGPVGTARITDVEDVVRGDIFKRLSTGVTYYSLGTPKQSPAIGRSSVLLSKDTPHG